MNKWLVLALIVMLTLAVTGITYAASSSFSDVPATHWAYESVTKLAQAGLIEGYSDGTFRGDKTMSRYEFAIMAEKAIENYEKADEANKNIIDALSAEFSSELNRMGARLTKVEAKTNVWLGGDTRMRYVTDSPSHGAKKMKGSDSFDFRQRIKFSGTINDRFSFQGRISTNYGNKWGNTDSAYGSNAYFDIFNITAKNVLGLDSIRVGRTSLDVIGNGLIGKPMAVDGMLIKKTIGQTKFSAWTGNVRTDTNINVGTGDSGNAYQLTTSQFRYNVNKKMNIGLGYYWADEPGESKVDGTGKLNTNRGSFDGSKGYDLAITYKLGGLTLMGDYIGSSLKNATNLPKNPKAWVIQLSNGTGPGANAVYYNAALLVNPNKVRNSAWAISYRNVDAGALPYNAGGFDTQAVAYPNQPYSIFTHGTDNAKVWFLSYEYVLDKNIVLSLEYQDFKIKNRSLTSLDSDDLNKCFMTKLEFFY